MTSLDESSSLHAVCQAAQHSGGYSDEHRAAIQDIQGRRLEHLMRAATCEMNTRLGSWAAVLSEARRGQRLGNAWRPNIGIATPYRRYTPPPMPDYSATYTWPYDGGSPSNEFVVPAVNKKNPGDTAIAQAVANANAATGELGLAVAIGHTQDCDYPESDVADAVITAIGIRSVSASLWQAVLVRDVSKSSAVEASVPDVLHPAFIGDEWCVGWAGTLDNDLLDMVFGFGDLYLTVGDQLPSGTAQLPGPGGDRRRMFDVALTEPGTANISPTSWNLTPNPDGTYVPLALAALSPSLLPHTTQVIVTVSAVLTVAVLGSIQHTDGYLGIDFRDPADPTVFNAFGPYYPNGVKSGGALTVDRIEISQGF